MSVSSELNTDPSGAVCISSPAIQQMMHVLPIELFYGVVEQSSVAISVTDAKAMILYCNMAFCRLTGYKRGEVQFHNHNILASQQTPKSRYIAMWNTLTQHRPWMGRLINKRKDGSLYLAELTVTPVVDHNNEITHFLGMHRDISDQFQLEQRVHNQKAMIEAVLDAAPNAIAVLNEKQDVILDNLAYKTLRTDLHGLEPLHELGFKSGAVVNDSDGFRPLLIRGRRYWFSVTIQPLSELNEEALFYFGEGKRPYQLLMITDQTARHQQLEQSRLEQLRIKVEEATLVSAMREILDVAIFQGQAPLNMLQAALRLDSDGSNEPDRTRVAIHSALHAGEQALQRLAHYRPVTQEELASVVDLRAICSDLLDMQAVRIQALHITTDVRIEEGLPQLQIQRIRLITALSLLFEKASQAAVTRPPADRKMAGKILTGKAQAGKVALCAYCYEQELFLEIHDNGEAPRETATHRLLQPELDGQPSNNTLSLQFSQNLVSDHRGVIEVLASYLGGSCIRLRLPLAAITGRSLS